MGDIDSFIGKYLLVGITYVDPDDQVVRQIQLHGNINRITDEEIFLLQANGKEFSLPPDVESLKPATQGAIGFGRPEKSSRIPT